MATKTVVQEGPFAQFIPEGVRLGNLITLSGQVSIDDQGEVVAPGDLIAQAQHAYVHVAATLEKLGAGMGDIVDETFFVTDVGAAMENIEALWKVRAEAYGGDPQVSQTMLQIGGLVMPELMIEIKVIASV
ncbi:MAG: RidA family protein [Acidimicrobiia bacterium]|nr:RidA family protein [Acidimicrobiia bacterium]